MILPRGFSQPDPATCTVALLLLGSLPLARAVTSRSAVLRRLATAMIGPAIAKVFPVDAAGLTGPLRMFPFLGPVASGSQGREAIDGLVSTGMRGLACHRPTASVAVQTSTGDRETSDDAIRQ